jgi:hypothetical protein
VANIYPWQSVRIKENEITKRLVYSVILCLLHSVKDLEVTNEVSFIQFQLRIVAVIH